MTTGKEENGEEHNRNQETHPSPAVQVWFARLARHQNIREQMDLKTYLAASQLDDCQRFYHEADRLRSILGRLLICKVLKEYGFDCKLAQQVQKTEYSRPYLPIPLDFNLSHSGDLVVCAGSPVGQIGIDTEKVRDVPLLDFQKTMTAHQWDDIHSASNPLDKFFHYWTMKESVIKADGRGLGIPLDKLEIKNLQVHSGENMYWLQALEIDVNHPTYLAMPFQPAKVSLFEANFPLDLC